MIKEKHPKFFLIENVQGIINDKHFSTFLSFLSTLEGAGYVVNYSLLNAADYYIPQDRYRVFVVGFLKELNCTFNFPKPFGKPYVTLRKAIGDIMENPHPYTNEGVDQEYRKWLNHDILQVHGMQNSWHVIVFAPGMKLHLQYKRRQRTAPFTHKLPK